MTPLLYAAQNGHLNIAIYLINHGADIHSKNNHILIWLII